MGVFEIGLVVAVTALLTMDMFLPGGFIEGSHDIATARTAGFTVLVIAHLFDHRHGADQGSVRALDHLRKGFALQLGKSDRDNGRSVDNDHFDKPCRSHCSGSNASGRSGMRSSCASNAAICLAGWEAPAVSPIRRSRARSITAVLLSPVLLASRSTLLSTTGSAIWNAMLWLLDVDLNALNIAAFCGGDAVAPLRCQDIVRRACTLAHRRQAPELLQRRTM